MGEDPLKLTERARVAAERHARAKADAEYMEHMRKVVLAKQIEDIRDRWNPDDGRMTESRLDNMARSSRPYSQHLDALREARQTEGTLAAEMYAARNQLDTINRMLDYARSEQYLTR